MKNRHGFIKLTPPRNEHDDRIEVRAKEITAVTYLHGTTHVYSTAMMFMCRDSVDVVLRKIEEELARDEADGGHKD